MLSNSKTTMARRFTNFEERSGYTGRIFERELFGEFDASDPAYQAELKRLMRVDVRGNWHVTFDDSVYLVRKYTKDNPTDPSKTFLRDLRLEILDALGRRKLLPDDAVKAYVSVGTPLDLKHKADAFFAIKQNSHEEIIRLDASIRPEKAEAAAAGEKGAEIFVGEHDVPDAVQEPDKYLEAVARYADKVLVILSERRRQNEERAA